MIDVTNQIRVLNIINDQDVMTLRTKSELVNFPLSEDTSELILNLKRQVINLYGLGMSAIQLGVPKAIFVMRKPWNSQHLLTIINPKILHGSGSSVKNEGCFSVDLPSNTMAMVRRMSMITVEYFTENGEKVTDEFMTGMDARIFQHEYQHLQGELFLDKDTKYGTFMGIRRIL